MKTNAMRFRITVRYKRKNSRARKQFSCKEFYARDTIKPLLTTYTHKVYAAIDLTKVRKLIIHII